MMNYMGKVHTQFLGKDGAPQTVATDKKIEWEWNHEHEKSWSDLKKLLIEDPVLRFFDPAKTIKISSNASQSGLRAVPLQTYDDCNELQSSRQLYVIFVVLKTADI